MMDWIKVILSILFCILYPIFWLVQGLLSVLGALLTPFLHLGSYAIHLTILPFRVLAKLESLYIFFSIASLIGITAGLVLHLISRLMVRVLHLSQEPNELDLPRRARKPARLSKDRLDQISSGLRGNLPYKEEDTWSSGYPEFGEPSSSTANAKISGNYYPGWTKATRGQQDRGLFSTTILEEDDDYSDTDEF